MLFHPSLPCICKGLHTPKHQSLQIVQKTVRKFSGDKFLMKRNQGYRQAKNPKANLENIQEGGQHEPSSYNNFVVHNLVNKTSHKTLQLE
jgi:hypothetical protein